MDVLLQMVRVTYFSGREETRWLITTYHIVRPWAGVQGSDPAEESGKNSYWSSLLTCELGTHACTSP